MTATPDQPADATAAPEAPAKTQSANALFAWVNSGGSGAPPIDFNELEQMAPLDSFLATLNLVNTGATTNDDLFLGMSQWMPHGRVFGGQVAAQSIVAASRTVPMERPIHSMRGYFLRPGDIREPITFSVDRIHDGGSFSTRHVQAYQRGLPIWSMVASFQAEEGGLDHYTPMPEGIPDPESLESEAAHVEQGGEALANYWVHRRPFAMRHVGGPIYLTPSPVREEVDYVWVKAMGELPDDPLVHRAALAYVSDYLMLDPALRKHGIAWIDSRIRVASLDHGVWWHRFARADEWLLFALHTPNAHSGRALTHGSFYTRDGVLVATVAQEAMLRLKETPAAQ